MTNRERLIAILEGRSPDQIPWIPRLQLWYNANKKWGTLPEKYRDWPLRDIERDLGMGTPARSGRVFTTAMKNVETTVHRKGREVLTEYVTPVGTVNTLQTGSAELERAGLGGRVLSRMIERPEDYGVVEYIIEHTEVTPTYEEYERYDEEIGEDGLPMVTSGDSPMNLILREYLGFELGYFDLYDRPDKVEHLLAVLTEHHREIDRIAAASPARLILKGVHFDSTMTPPPVFEQYFAPYLREVADLYHAGGKTLAYHADADSRLLLRLVLGAGLDMAECFVTEPMVSCTLREAREVWGTDMIIWGGIPSVLMCDPFTDEALEAFMIDVFRTVAPGDAFILGVADNVMPEAKFDRIVRVGQMVGEYGQYPIRS